MMFLIEIKNFEQFKKVLPHARRIMPEADVETISKLGTDFEIVCGQTASYLDTTTISRQ